MQNTDRRLEGRFLCADLVRLTWRKGDCLHDVEAVLEDISPVGACVQVEEEIPIGASITLSAGSKTLSGLVSYCAYRDYGYFVGIRFSDETHWSSSVFLPQHLLSLQGLASETSDGVPD
jgi:hypothetical protein